MIEIKKNDYVQDTQIREDVVKGICEAFMSQGVWSIFHPFNSGGYRIRGRYIVRHKGYGSYYGFVRDKSFTDSEFLEFNGSEMREAFRLLIGAGYHMFRVYEYGSWMGYRLSKKPFLQGGDEVKEFTDFID